MADFLANLENPIATLAFTETAANATIVQNIFQKTAAKLYFIKIDAVSNTSEDVFLVESRKATALMFIWPLFRRLALLAQLLLQVLCQSLC
jgi:hypothetical protein